MGDTHLDIAASRLQRKFAVEVLLDVPRVPFKETITVPVEAEYKHKKQTGGHGQYGHVVIKIEPLPPSGGFVFEAKVVGGSVPRNFIPAVERIGQVSMPRGKSQETVNQVITGDIGLVVKLANTASSDTLGVKEHPLKLAAIQYLAPVLSKAVHPKSKADLDKMSSGLARICEEDPSLRWQREADTGELTLGSMGATHLDIAASRLQRKFAVEVLLDVPRVPFKETITVPVEAEYKHKKQTGGHGQYGHVVIKIEPLPPSGGFVFEAKVVGGSVPRNFIPAVEKGVKEARVEGVIAGFPAVDMKVTLIDGSFHPVDSSEMAFKIASAQAFKKGMGDASPVLLEPIMNITVTVPDSFTGDIIGDLNTKRAHVSGMSPSQGTNVIQAQAPLAEILRYAIDLRSMTQGRGTFTVGFSHYQAAPAPIAAKIVAQHKSATPHE
jgi:elongation factor G